MIDLHTHTLLSDGELVPSELVRRAKMKGYSAIGLSDHVDISTIASVIGKTLRLMEKIGHYEEIQIIPGVELTHVPPTLIPEMIGMARKLGACYVVVHGETLSEPVEAGTNRAAIEGGADILAHPGLITEEEMTRARERGTFIEITTRKGHSLANGHVARLACKVGTRLVIDTDTHGPADLVTEYDAERIVCGAGLEKADFMIMQDNARELIRKALKQ